VSYKEFKLDSPHIKVEKEVGLKKSRGRGGVVFCPRTIVWEREKYRVATIYCPFWMANYFCPI